MNLLEYVINFIAFQIVFMLLSIPAIILILILGKIIDLLNLPILEVIPSILSILYVCAVFWLIHKSAKLRVYEGFSFRQSMTISFTELKSLVIYLASLIVQIFKSKID